MLQSRWQGVLEGSLPTQRLSVASVYWMIGAVSGVMWGGAPGNWRATHWLFTYQNGIPRRALPGSLLSLTGDLTYGRITVVSVALYVVVVGLLGWSLSGLTDGDGKRLLTVLILLVSPVGFPFLAANIGRFDTILIILTVVAVWLLNRGRYLGLYAVVAVMGLVHEAALLLVVAWLAGLLAYRRIWRPAIGVLVVAAGLASGMMMWTPSISLDEMSNRLFVDVPVVRGSIGVLYTDLLANLHVGLSFLLSTAGVRWLLKVTVASAAVVIAGWKLKNRWLLAGSLVPLVLLFVGTDYERWLAFAAGLLIVSLLIHGREFHSEGALIGLAVISLGMTVVFGGGLVFTISEVFRV